MKICRIPFPMFVNLSLTVFTFREQDGYVNCRRKRWGNYQDSYTGAGCWSGRRGGKFCVEIALYIPKRNKVEDPKTLLHECLHAVQFIGENYGIKDPEFDAYFLEYIWGYAQKRLKL